MKRKVIPWVIVLVIMILQLTSCKSNEKDIDRINVESIKSISIKTLPSPPKVKLIDKKTDLDKVINFLNSINYMEAEQEHANGWEFWIQFTDEKEYSISFIGNRVHFNNKWYIVDESILKDLRELYNELEYEESILY